MNETRDEIRNEIENCIIRLLGVSNSVNTIDGHKLQQVSHTITQISISLQSLTTYLLANTDDK